MIVAVTGLVREAKIIKSPDVKIVIGGGHNLDSKISNALGDDVRGIISIGIAGGLAPDLKPGDCAIATEILSGTERLLADMAWRRTLMQVLPFAKTGVIAGSDAIVASVDAKAALHRDTRARVVDMESHIVARAAQERKIPFAALRVVSDAYDCTLPPAALAAMKSDGGINYGAVIGSLLTRPWQIPALMRTARDANAAFAALLRCRDLLGPCLGFPNLG
jgi:adenosylhomocysteine nucleosidase